MTEANLDNPILNSPYDPPEQHFELGPDGPTGDDPRRAADRASRSSPSRRRRRASKQQALDFDATGERRELNTLINDIRFEVERWRARSYPGVTPITRKLLQHWAAQPPEREDPMFFCQREAAETAIYLAEAAGRHGNPDFRTRIDPENDLHNDGLPRVALKMATGTGKTVVMAMLIAWQTINKVANPNDARFAKRFLIVTPGITIRDRLRVLEPADPDNYYRERDRRPARPLGMRCSRRRSSSPTTTRSCSRDAKEIQGVASQHPQDPHRRQDGRPVQGDRRPDGRPRAARPRRAAAAARQGRRDRRHQRRGPPLLPRQAARGPDAKLDSEDKKEAEQRNADARVWFKGLQAIRKKVGIKAIYDLSATPVLPARLGLQRGLHLPVDRERLLADGRDRVGHREGAPHSRRRRRQGRRHHLQAALGLRRPGASEEEDQEAARSSPSGSRPRSSKVRSTASTAATERRFEHWEQRARAARRTAAGDDRRLPQHARLEARLRLDRRHATSSATTARRSPKPGELPLLSQRRRTGSGRRVPARSSSTPRSSSPAR